MSNSVIDWVFCEHKGVFHTDKAWPHASQVCCGTRSLTSNHLPSWSFFKHDVDSLLVNGTEVDVLQQLHQRFSRILQGKQSCRLRAWKRVLHLNQNPIWPNHSLTQTQKDSISELFNIYNNDFQKNSNSTFTFLIHLMCFFSQYLTPKHEN